MIAWHVLHARLRPSYLPVGDRRLIDANLLGDLSLQQLLAGTPAVFAASSTLRAVSRASIAASFSRRACHLNVPIPLPLPFTIGPITPVTSGLYEGFFLFPTSRRIHLPAAPNRVIHVITAADAAKRRSPMKIFTIENETNNITIHATIEDAETPANAERFRTEAQLAKLAADWPAVRLVEIWNSLPGETPVKKFKDRATAVSRIWKAIQSLAAEPIIDAASEPKTEPIEPQISTDASAECETAGAADQISTEKEATQGEEKAVSEPEESTVSADVAPQTPGVAPEAAPLERQGHSREGAQNERRCTEGGQQDQPGDRDAQARGRYDAGRDHDRDGLAETHHARHAERGRLADEEPPIHGYQREGRRPPALLDQRLN